MSEVLETTFSAVLSTSAYLEIKFSPKKQNHLLCFHTEYSYQNQGIFPVIGSLNISKLGALFVNNIKQISKIPKTIIATFLLHPMLLVIHLYDTYSPSIIAITNEDTSIIAKFFPIIPVYV